MVTVVLVVVLVGMMKRVGGGEKERVRGSARSSKPGRSESVIKKVVERSEGRW